MKKKPDTYTGDRALEDREKKLDILRREIDKGDADIEAGRLLDGEEAMAKHRQRLLALKGKKPRSEISAVIHESVTDFYESGVVDEKTMREFDESCLIELDESDAD